MRKTLFAITTTTALVLPFTGFSQQLDHPSHNGQISNARAQALQECNAQLHIRDHTSTTIPPEHYRSCMIEHG
jgi:hypothetical protein